MYGAMLGDMIGAPYEFISGMKTKDFPLFTETTDFTDDTVMTFAIFEGILAAGADIYENASEETIKKSITETCQKWGRAYPDAGYGGRFIQWLFMTSPEPYNSFGNGSAMRVSSVGWLYKTLEKTREVARWTAEITHNHPEGIKGAESVASAIWMAREGYTKKDIKNYIEKEFSYNLDQTYDQIRPKYSFDVTCQGSVPQSIIAFLEGKDFEDTIRNAVSLGGDSDTQGAIAGSIAEAYFGIPENLKQECRDYMTEEMVELMNKFDKIKYERKINQNKQNK